MGKLFKYLRQHAGVVLAIIVVPFVQAFCDLSLPTYTSDIVNVGIQQGGIDTTVPEQMKESDLEDLLLLVPQKDADTVREAYREGTKKDLNTDESFYVLKDSVAEDEETGEPVDVDADDEEYGLVIMKAIVENGEELLSTPDSDEELDMVYNLFMERFFEEEDEE